MIDVWENFEDGIKSDGLMGKFNTSKKLTFNAT